MAVITIATKYTPKRFLSSRDKILTKMTRDGAVEQVNGDEKRISKREVSLGLRGDGLTDKHILTKNRELIKRGKTKITRFPGAVGSADTSDWAQGQRTEESASPSRFDVVPDAPSWLEQQRAEEYATPQLSDEATKPRSSRLKFDKGEATPVREEKSSSKARKKAMGADSSSEQSSAYNSATQPDNPATKPKVSKLEHLESRVQKTSDKLEKAKGNLPTKRRPRIKRDFNEATGKAQTRITFEREVKSQKEHIKGALPLRPVKFGVNAAIATAHKKMFQVEDDNVGTKATHRTELVAEGAVRSALRHRKTAPYKKVAKLEQKLSKQSARLAYERTVEKNPALKKNSVARMWQKYRIKRQHMKALRQQRQAAASAKKAATLTGRATRALGALIKKNPKVIILGVLLFVVLNIVSSLMGVLQGLGSGGLGAILSSTYLSEESDITSASFIYTQWEMDLRIEIENAEQNHPGYDEYRYFLDDFHHDPFELIAYLTATRYAFAFSDVEAVLREIFDAQYTLELVSEIEIRTRLETRTGSGTNPDGSSYSYTYTVVVEYEWRILNIILTAMPLSEILAERLDTEQGEHFDLLMDSSGARQFVGNPFSFDWRSSVTSLFGYRVHPITGARDNHRGLDIAAPTGTPLHAGIDGTIAFAGVRGDFGNLVIITGADGLEIRYAHMHSIGVSQGQEIGRGEFIGAVGSTGASTGPHLHIEILRNGTFLDPLFFLNAT